MLNWLTTARAEDVTVWWPYLKIFIEFWRWGRRERWESSAHCRSCMCIDVTGWLQRNSHSAFHSPIKPHKTASVAGISNTRRTETLHKSCWRDPGEINTWVPCSLGWPANPKLSKLKKQSQTASWKSHKRRSTAEITAWKRCRQCRKWSWDGQMHFVHINSWTGIFLWHLKAATEKAAPRSCRCVQKGQNCSHLQSFNTSFEGELLQPLFPLVPVVDVTPQLLCVQAESCCRSLHHHSPSRHDSLLE